MRSGLTTDVHPCATAYNHEKFQNLRDFAGQKAFTFWGQMLVQSMVLKWHNFGEQE